MDPITVVINGPESSGKSSLCEALANHFGVSWTPEYARAYLEEREGDYDQASLLAMHQGQRMLSLAAKESALHLVFIDTDSINFAVWEKRVFQTLSPEIETALKEPLADFYLLCAPDLEWVADPLRENPFDRDEIFEEHLAWIKKSGIPYGLVKGQKEERLKNALAALQQFNPSLSAD